MLTLFRHFRNRHPASAKLSCKVAQADADQAALDLASALYAEAGETTFIAPDRPLPPVQRGFRGQPDSDP